MFNRFKKPSSENESGTQDAVRTPHAPKKGTTFTKGMLAGLFGLAAMGAYGSYYSVDPTEMANVRRLGTVLYDTPVVSGPHFKLPFVDTVDKIQVSLTTVQVPAFDVTTIDNQKVTLDLNFNFTIPKSDVNHLLYGVGRVGNSDIDESIRPIVKDRAGRVFAHQNMITVNQNWESIRSEIEKSLFESVHAQFGIDPGNLQMTIRPSEAFMASNEAAIRTKNETIAAQNTKNTRQAEADQQVIIAKGAADSAIAAAKGRAESVTIEAEANEKKLEFEGLGQQSRLKAEINAFGTPELYVEYVKAQAGLKWNGQQPMIVTGQGASTNLIVPLPQAAQSPAPAVK